jgi:hypothetical protein
MPPGGMRVATFNCCNTAACLWRTVAGSRAISAANQVNEVTSFADKTRAVQLLSEYRYCSVQAAQTAARNARLSLQAAGSLPMQCIRDVTGSLAHTTNALFTDQPRLLMSQMATEE